MSAGDCTVKLRVITRQKKYEKNHKEEIKSWKPFMSNILFRIVTKDLAYELTTFHLNTKRISEVYSQNILYALQAALVNVGWIINVRSRTT